MQSFEIFSTPWILVSGAVFFAAIVRGMSGFGLALILAPILLLLISPREVVVLNLLLSFLGQIWVLYRSFRNIDFGRIMPMMVSSLAGIPLGAWIINAIAPSSLKVVMGIVILCFAIPIAFGYRRAFSKERLSSGLAGFFSGVLSSATSLGGPPIVLFMHNQDWPKEKIHPSLAAQFMVLSTSSLIALSIAGNVSRQLVLTAASFAPIMFVGIYLGMVLFRTTSARFFRNVSMVIVLCTAVLGVLSGFGVFP